MGGGGGDETSFFGRPRLGFASTSSDSVAILLPIADNTISAVRRAMNSGSVEGAAGGAGTGSSTGGGGM